MALAFAGENSPPYRRVQELAEHIQKGLEPLLDQGFFPVVAVEADLAKVLGQALANCADLEGQGLGDRGTQALIHHYQNPAGR